MMCNKKLSQMVKFILRNNTHGRCAGCSRRSKYVPSDSYNLAFDIELFIGIIQL